MPLPEREVQLTRFNVTSRPAVLLMTIASGGVGINLTSVSLLWFMLSDG